MRNFKRSKRFNQLANAVVPSKPVIALCNMGKRYFVVPGANLDWTQVARDKVVGINWRMTNAKR